MKKKICAVILSLAALCFLLPSCGNEETESHDRLSIVTTNFAFFDFARAVAGNSCDVTMLLALGSEAHDLEATLADVAEISESDLFICTGAEDWVDDIFASMGDNAAQPRTIRAMDLVQEKGTEVVLASGSCAIDGEHDHEHEAGQLDEHVWTSIGNAEVIMNEIAAVITELDPSLTEVTEAYTTSYFSRLDEIDAGFREAVEAMNGRKAVFADRFPFVYMAERYGMPYEAAFSGCTSATEPPLSVLQTLIDTVEEEQTKAVFIIEFSDGKTAEAVAAETGCDILTFQSAHNVSEEDFMAGITYADIMEENLRILNSVFHEAGEAEA